jgi:nucleoid DNA-binding protein
MPTTLTKDELAKALAEKTGLGSAIAHANIQVILDEIQNALANDRKVEFRGFGVLRPVMRKARTGRNPRDLAAGVYQIPPRKVVKFKVGSLLDAALNPEAKA